MNAKRRPTELRRFAALVTAAVFVVLAVVGVVQTIRTKRAVDYYGGQRMTRTQAERSKDNRTVYLVPDSEFLPESPDP